MTELGINIAVIENGHVLLTKREDFEVWCLPGGGLEPGESVVHAAMRETFEETGLEIELTRLVGVYSRLGGAIPDAHAILFSAIPVGGTLQIQPEETIDLGWFAPDDIPDETLEWHRQRIFDALNGVGGVVWSQHTRSRLVDEVQSRKELYELRDRSGLSRQAFYLQFVEALRPEDEILELGGHT